MERIRKTAKACKNAVYEIKWEILDDMISPEQWRKELNADIDEIELGRLRANTHTGRPLGSDSFLSKLEKLLGRRVRPLPVARPTKKRTKMSK